MSRQLKVEFIQSGVHESIGVVQGSQIYIGREPDEGGIAVPSHAVSRNHGIFVRFRTNWFYKDLGSTNGSWVNGVVAKEGVWKLVRSGDVMQLADAAIALTEDNTGLSPESKISGFPALGGVSLLVFSKGEFLDEYPVPEYGRALIIGGSQGDLQIEGALEEMPTLVIERRSMNVCAFPVAKNIPVQLNAQPLMGSLNLNDRDEVSASYYNIIFNNPISNNRTARVGEEKVEQSEGSQVGPASRLKEWGEHEKHPDLGGGLRDIDLSDDRGAPHTQGVFGRSKNSDYESEGTVPIDPSDVEAQIARYDMHPSMRYVMDEPETPSFANLDEKIIFAIGIVLIVGILGLTVYWLVG